MDFLIFSTIDMPYKAIQAPVPSLCAYPFFPLIKVTHNTGVLLLNF